MPAVVTIGSATAGPGEKTLGSLTVLERSVSDVAMPVGIINSGAPGPRVVISAGIHGSEYAGIEAAGRLWRTLTPEAIAGSVAIFFVVNVPGFEAGEANVNPLDNLNLNRVFPGSPTGSPSLIMAHRLAEEVGRFAEFVIDLHGGDATEELNPFAVYFPGGNEEVDRTSARMADLCDTPFIWKIRAELGYAGTFSGELARRRIPSAVCEAGFLGTYREDDIAHHVRAVTNVLKNLGTLLGEPEFRRPKPP